MSTQPLDSKLLETRVIENGVTAKIFGRVDGSYLVAIHGTEAIPMASSRIFGDGTTSLSRSPSDVASMIDLYIRRAFNVSRMFSEPGDEDTRALNLRILEM